MNGTPGAGRRWQSIATPVVLVLAVITLVSACGAKTETGANSESTAVARASAPTTDPTATPAGGTAAPSGQTANLLGRVATVGADAALEARFAGEVTAAKSGDSPLVFFGRSADQALVYICDGTKAAWYTGSVDASGAGTLKATAGTDTVQLTNAGSREGDQLEAQFAAGAFDKLSAKLTKTDTSTTLVRIDRPLPEGDTLIGGIILTPDAVRGVVTITPPAGPSVSTTSTTSKPAGMTGPVLVSKTPTGLLSFSFPPSVSLAPASNCDPQVLRAAAATIESLADNVKAAKQAIETIQQQLAALQARLGGATPEERTALQNQIDLKQQQINQLQKQIEKTTAQIDNIRQQIDGCGGTTNTK